MKAAIIIAASLAAAISAKAQYIWFDQNTDTIQVPGQVEFGTACTMEAIFYLPSSHQQPGFLLDEWAANAEDKFLYVSDSFVSANTSSNQVGRLSAATPLALDTWQHIAYVSDGSEERLYLDGILVDSRPRTQPISNGGGLLYIGKPDRRDSSVNGFVGFLDAIRLSKNARYRGDTFTPPKGDFSSDASTVLLYNFSEAPGSLIVKDSSPLGRDGLLGTGFAGATSPKLVSVIPNLAPIGLEIRNTAGALVLEFNALFGMKYQIQASVDLAAWADYGTVMIGAGTTLQKRLSLEPDVRKFFRVLISK